MEDREIEKTTSLADFIVELRRLADTLESEQTFSVEIEGEEIIVPKDAISSIVYEIEDGKAEIEFQLNWTVETDEEEDESEEDAEDEEDGDDAEKAEDTAAEDKTEETVA